jgi:hypothetical protein
MFKQPQDGVDISAALRKGVAKLWPGLWTVTRLISLEDWQGVNRKG